MIKKRIYLQANLNNSEDLKLSIFIVAYFIASALNMSIKLIFAVSNATVWSYISSIFFIILFIILLFTIHIVFKRTLLLFVCLEAIFLLIFICSYFMGNADNALLTEKAFFSLGVGVPLFCYVYAIKDKNILYNNFLIISYPLIIIIIFAFIMNSSLIKGNNTYTMSLSYSIMLPVLFQTSAFFKKKHPINLFFAICGTLSIILFGSRGALICIFGYLLYKALLNKIFSAKRFMQWLALGGICAIVLFNIDKVFSYLYAFLTEHGIYSRTLYIITSSDLLYSSGRIDLWSHYWQLICDKPFFGWGVIGGWVSDGLSPHNMLIEYLLAFGIIIGGLICITSVLLLLKPFFVKDRFLLELTVILASANLAMYLVSGDVFEKSLWFIFIALCFTKEPLVPEQETKSVINHLEG